MLVNWPVGTLIALGGSLILCLVRCTVSYKQTGISMGNAPGSWLYPGIFPADYILFKYRVGDGNRQKSAVFSQKEKGILFDGF